MKHLLLLFCLLLVSGLTPALANDERPLLEAGIDTQLIGELNEEARSIWEDLVSCSGDPVKATEAFFSGKLCTKELKKRIESLVRNSLDALSTSQTIQITTNAMQSVQSQTTLFHSLHPLLSQVFLQHFVSHSKNRFGDVFDQKNTEFSSKFLKGLITEEELSKLDSFFSHNRTRRVNGAVIRIKVKNGVKTDDIDQLDCGNELIQRLALRTRRSASNSVSMWIYASIPYARSGYPGLKFENAAVFSMTSDMVFDHVFDPRRTQNALYQVSYNARVNSRNLSMGRDFNNGIANEIRNTELMYLKVDGRVSSTIDKLERFFRFCSH